MRLFNTGLTLLAAVCFARPALASEVAPDALFRNITNDVLKIVRQDKDIANIYAQVEQKILPVFDFRHMAQLAMGKHWSKATPEQQDKLAGEFKLMLVRTYASSLASVADYKGDFIPSRGVRADREAVVSAEVIRPNAPPIRIDYKLDKQSGGWKVIDVVVDDVSLVTMYRGSFNTEVRKGGIEDLIATLVRRNR